MAKKSRIRNFGKKALFLFNILVSLLFLYPLFFTPTSFIWINGFLGLIAPYLIAIEILTLGGYTLIAYNRKNFFSTYAGVQYFILGAIPSAFLLLGFIFLYKT